MKPNIGIINALIRITAGLSMLTCYSMRANKNRDASSASIFMIICAAMKVAEGIVRYCPLTAAYNEMQDQSHNQNQTQHQLNNQSQHQNI